MRIYLTMDIVDEDQEQSYRLLSQGIEDDAISKEWPERFRWTVTAVVADLVNTAFLNVGFPYYTPPGTHKGS